MTGRLIAQQWMSVDGMVSGPRDEWELFAAAPPESAEATEAYNRELVAGFDTMVLGRRSYESFREVWPTSDNPMAAQVNALSKVICSTSLADAPWGDHPAGRVVRDGVAWARVLPRRPRRARALRGTRPAG